MVEQEKLTAAEFQQMMNSTSIIKDNKGNLITNHSLDSRVINGNKKIKNTKKHIWRGISFDSTLEMEAYQRFSMHKIIFEFKRKYMLVEGFKYEGTTFQPITWTPDFVFDDLKIVLDTKGFPNDVFPLKLKLFHKYLHDKNLRGWQVIIVHNKTELSKFIEKYF